MRSADDRSSGGGPTAGGGFNYQAAVTAIALCHAACGARLGWLDGLEDDAPTAVAAETGAGGDDLRLTFAAGAIAEVQVKRGLRAGAELWTALDALAQALDDDKTLHALLVVSPTTSNTIKHVLAADLIVIGQGGQVADGRLGARWIARLTSQNLDPTSICARLRIVTVAAQAVDEADVRGARAQLASLCPATADQTRAWDRLYRDAHLMIEQRGRRSRSDIARILRSGGVALRHDASAPAGLLAQLCAWTAEVNADFTILGVQRPLSIDKAFIVLDPYVPVGESDTGKDLADAVTLYQDWNRRVADRDAAVSAPHALGRFYRRSVVVAGPGMGKSTLMARLARAYAIDGLPVLKLSALALAQRRSATGETFLEAALTLGLQGSGITPAMALGAGLSDWVMLLDGLDEAGAHQIELAKGLNALTQAWPDLRVVATTRPVGYRRASFASWRHYALPGIASGDGARLLTRLLGHILPPHDPRREGLSDHIGADVERSDLSETVLRSPLMIGLAAAVFAAGGPLGGSRPAFYRAIFELLDREPPPRALAKPATKPVLARFLDALGWSLAHAPQAFAEEVLEACARVLGEDLSLPPLQARDLTDRICAYWESLGVIERLHHAGDTALAFVHKTFGEYAAGRYLAAQSLTTRQAVIDDLIDNDAWTEPLAFTAAMGGAEEIIARLEAGGFDESTAGQARLVRALSMLADAPQPPRQDLTDRLLDAGFARLKSDRQSHGSAVGAALHALGPASATGLLARAQGLMNHPLVWTRLAAHAICEKTAPSLLDLPEWLSALRELAVATVTNHAQKLDSPFSADGQTRDLLSDFGLRLAARAIDTLDVVEAQAFVDDMVSGSSLNTLGHLSRLERLLVGKPLTLKWKKDWAASMAVPSPETLIKRMRGTFGAIMGGIASEAEIRADESSASLEGRPLYLLAALFEHMGFRQTSLPDLWPMEWFGADPDVRALWRLVLQLSGLPTDRVTAEAAEMQQAIAAYGGEALSLIFKRFPEVDVPPLTWAGVRDLSVDRDLLETTLQRPSSFVVVPAVKVVLGLNDPLFQEELARRLLGKGKDLTLWAGCELASHLPSALAETLLLQAASTTPRSGFEHLFNALERLDAASGPKALDAVRASLLSSLPEAAAASANYVAKAPHPDFGELLNEAWAHWLVTEAPYPKAGGVVPTSPRDALLRAMLILSPKPWRELVSLHGDSRPDVGAVAATALAAQLKDAALARTEAAHALGAGEITPKLTRLILRSTIPFTRRDVETILDLLSHPDAHLRLEAVHLLDSEMLSIAERRQHLERLRTDPRSEIREAAERKLEWLEITPSPLAP